MPTRAPVPSPVATSSSAIVALSQDEALLRALMMTMLEQAAIVTSASIDRFIEQVAANCAQVALIDATSAPSPVAAFTERLRAQFPELRMVLTGSASLQTELSAQIADGTIFRFAAKPASAQRLKVFLNAALRRSCEQHGELAASTAEGGMRSISDAPRQEHGAATAADSNWLQRLWRSS